MLTYLVLGFCLTGLAVADDSVTYPGIGTFHRNDFYDILHRPINFLPQSPEHISPEFSLFNRKNSHDGQTLKYNEVDSVKKSSFNASLNTKIIVHGFLDNKLFGDWMEKLKDDLLERLDVNVIITDWTNGNGLPYGQATANTRVVGPMIAILIKTIGEANGAKPDNFHILGHSLGSHVAGYAGKFLNGTLGHITGLDPAGPYYEGIKSEGRLWHTDAQFVEAIHSDAEALFPTLGFGMYETCAHIDFYPNGGKHQPGCNEERFTSIIIGGLGEAARRLVACNHQRAVDFYMSSLLNPTPAPKGYLCDDYDSFKAGKCTDCGAQGEKCAILGPLAEDWKKSVSGSGLGAGGKRFFLTTDGSQPYFKYQYAIGIKFSSAHSEEHGKIQLEVSDLHGTTENFDFNGNDEVFHAGQTYSQVFLFNSDLNDIHSIGFEWTRGLIGIILKHWLYIDSIEFTPLTQADAKVTPVAVKLCPPGHDGIKNNDKVYFTTNC